MSRKTDPDPSMSAVSDDALSIACFGTTPVLLSWVTPSPWLAVLVYASLASAFGKKPTSEFPIASPLS